MSSSTSCPAAPTPFEPYILVINQHVDRECVEEGVRVYIGRPTVLGNPFVIGRNGNRTEVIRRYQQYLKEKLAAGDKDITAEIARLVGIAQERPLELACFCAPAGCHGDVIKAVLLERIQMEGGS